MGNAMQGALRPRSVLFGVHIDGMYSTLELPAGTEVELTGATIGSTWNGEVLEAFIDVSTEKDVLTDSCTALLDFEFERNDFIIANGYQSWTDTHELHPSDTMRGLNKVPRSIINKWVLDGSGDYRFAKYDNDPGLFHGWTYAEIRRKADCVLVASLDESDGFTEIDVSAAADLVFAEKEERVDVLPQGKTVLLRLCVVAGSEDEVFDRWMELAGIVARPALPLTGYSSWYRHYGEIDFSKLRDDVKGCANTLDDLGVLGYAKDGRVLAVGQIDDGWCKVGDWLQPDVKNFPLGMAPMATRITLEGLTPGLWLAPFVCEKNSQLAKEHPDWLMRDIDGKPVTTGCHWSGGLALDSRNPEVREYVQSVIRMATQDWGFKLLKLDFLYAACMVPHDNMNRGQLMADAVALLREAAGDNVAIIGCGVPLASAFGQFEYCRIGCDVSLEWDGKPYMRKLHRERESTKNSMLNTLCRAPLDGRAFGNDPDVFFLRDDVSFSRRRRRELLQVDCSFGSVLMTSDDMGSWTKKDRKLFKESLEVVMARKEARR